MTSLKYHLLIHLPVLELGHFRIPAHALTKITNQ